MAINKEQEAFPSAVNAVSAQEHTQPSEKDLQSGDYEKPR